METPAAVRQIDSRRMLVFLLVLTAASQMGIQGWQTLFNNFSVERAGFAGWETGLVQSIREVPGFLALLVIYVLMILSEHRLVALSILLLGLGVGLSGQFPNFYGIVATTLIMSFGFHYYETLNQSLTLQYFDRTQTPLVLGRLRSVTGFTNIAVGLMVLFASKWLDYAWLYGIIGGFVVLAGLWGLTQDPSDKEIPLQRKKMFLRRRYWLYYCLTFLVGARRQILTTFAVFLLVKKFGFTIQEVTLLFIVNNTVNIVANPLIGKAINRFGERTLLGLEYATVIPVFLAYAYSDSRQVVALMYVLDQLFFNFAMCVGTYFQKIADPQDIAPTMAVGFTINHIAAVAIPVMGGFLWMWDYRAVFLGGAALSVCSLILSRFIRTREPEPRGVPAES